MQDIIHAPRSSIPAWNTTSASGWPARLLNPNSEAIVDITSGRRQTYVELDARCNQVGNGLVAGGLAQGDRVATLLMNGPEFVETFFGAAKVGGVIVALNWRLVADELSFILTDSGASTLVFGTAFNEVVAELQSAAPMAPRSPVGSTSATPPIAPTSPKATRT